MMGWIGSLGCIANAMRKLCHFDSDTMLIYCKTILFETCLHCC